MANEILIFHTIFRLFCDFPVVLNGLPERIYVRVIDPFTIKPLDSKTIIDHTRATKGRIITVEDHYYEGTPLGNMSSYIKGLAWWVDNCCSGNRAPWLHGPCGTKGLLIGPEGGMRCGRHVCMAAALLRRDPMASSHWPGRGPRAFEPAWRGRF